MCRTYDDELHSSESFTTIPTTIWWSLVTFTTIGYGDMMPRTVGPNTHAIHVALLHFSASIANVFAIIITNTVAIYFDGFR